MVTTFNYHSIFASGFEVPFVCFSTLVTMPTQKKETTKVS